jgi:ATP-binding protein involved in chromosome partitioning
MSVVSPDQIQDALAQIKVPKLDKSILELDVVQDVSVDAGHVKLTLKFNIPAYASKSELRDWVTQAVSNLPGVDTVDTDFVSGPAPANNNADSPQSAPLPSRMIQLPQVACIIAVFSGKGGVGKSTVSSNLAVALTMLGEKVGLFDADLHGPSVPTIMGSQERPRMDGQKMHPLVQHGVKTMSVGYLVEEDEPLIWRGPMITKGINELLETTEWGALDFLILDLPPGTGDAQLGLAQDVRLDGSIAVTTPQNVALADVHRGIAAFKKLEVPIWGVIENMSYFVCPGCGEEAEIFGKGGGEKESVRQGIPLLGRLPIDPTICETGDSGTPIVSANPEHSASLEFKRMAAALIETSN